MQKIVTRENFLKAVSELKVIKSERLNTCQAYIETCDYNPTFNDTPILLRSYNTHVAMFLPKSNTLFVFDYYSATTNTTHIPKFANKFVVLRRINLYYRKRIKGVSTLCYYDGVMI